MSDVRSNSDCIDDQVPEAAKGIAGLGADVGNRAMNAAGVVYKKAEDAASYVSQKAADATTAVGGTLKSMGDSVRTNAPHTGLAGDASNTMADTLESSGQYIQSHGFSGATEDLTNVIRRNPITSLLAAVGVGFLIAQATARQR